MAPPKLTKQSEGPATLAVITIEGVAYKLPAEKWIDFEIREELFVQAGYSMQRAVTMLTQAEIAGLAPLVFVARRCAGERVQYTEVRRYLQDVIRAADGEEFPVDIDFGPFDSEPDGEVPTDASS